MEVSAVESVAKLAQIHLQILGAGSMVSAIDESLCVSNDAMQPLQQFSASTEILVLMDIAALGKRLTAASETIRLDGSSRFDILTHKAAHRRTLDVVGGVHLQVNRMALFILGYGNKYRLVSSTSTFFALDLGSKIRIIERYDTFKVILLVQHLHGSTDPTEHIPCSLIADFDLSGQSQGRNTTLITGNQVNCPEPFGQGQMSTVHDGIGSQSGLVSAPLTLVTAIADNGIMFPTAALWAHVTLRPLYLIQVFSAGLFCRESLDKPAET